MRTLASLLCAATLAACSGGGGYIPRRDGGIPDFAGRDGQPADFAGSPDFAQTTDFGPTFDFAQPVDSAQSPDLASSCSSAGNGCTTSYTCCKGLYCQNSVCTATPSCGVIGAACVDYTTCCESDSMDCVGSKCCIEAMFQNATSNMIRCFANNDCCGVETCDQATGLCK
jgi:hypothetical protein